MDDELKPEATARLFHDTYERLAPSFGYETRPDTKAFDPESANGRLMIAVCGEVAKATRPPKVEGDNELAVAGNGRILTTSDVEEVIEGLETNATEHFADAVRLLRYMAGELATPVSGDNGKDQVERKEALLDSQYRAGAKAGWNAQFADDPEAAIQHLIQYDGGLSNPQGMGKDNG